MATTNLMDYTTEQLYELLALAYAEAFQIELEMNPLESMTQDVRFLICSQPPKQMNGGAKFGIGFLVFMVLGLIGGILGEADILLIGSIILIAAAVVPFFIVRAMNQKKKQEFADWESRLTLLQEKVKAQEILLAETIKEVADKSLLIPEEYRYSFALDTMMGFLDNHRADNWRDCMNLYEEQKHRWLLEQNSKEGLLLQRQMAQSAERAASSAEAAAFFGAVTAVNTSILARQATK